MSNKFTKYSIPKRVLDSPKRFDFIEREKFWRLEWSKFSISNRKRNFSRDKSFVIDSPPPTVSGSLHVGHVFSYTHQDLIARYKRMTGWNVVYPMGWDDNGLPTERRVQNFYNVRAEPGIAYEENINLEKIREQKGLKKSQQLIISRQNFIEMCHQITSLDEVAFKDLFDRMGFSIDWIDEYATIDDKSRRIAQRSFNDLVEKDQVYQNESPTMWDVDFQTAVAQAEIEDRDKPGAYHDLEFKIRDDDEYFFISTTRPELLPACVGITAHPEDSRFKKFFGKEAVTPLFFANVPIFPSDLVDPNKGTGILMVCTFGDQTDVQWWRENSLDLRQILSKDGRFLPVEFGSKGWESLNPKLANFNYEKLKGKKIFSAKKEIIDLLREPKNAFKDREPILRLETKEITHPVRFYEKGDKPIEYLSSRQWFIKTIDKKSDLISAGKKINWHPEFMRKRFENWTENLNIDWCISRQRFFGVPIPVWYKIDSKGIINYDEYITAPDDMLPVDPSIHAPYGYKESQRNKPNGFIGETDVFDTWFTSSLSPQIVAKWLDPEDEMENIFPMDIRPQSHEIIRTWAFYTIVKSLIHHNEIPWKNVIISGWVLDPDRKKMSKSKGNVIVPTDILDQFGADSVRYWASSFRLGSDATNDEKIFKIGSKLVTKMYNAGKFVLTQEGVKGEITEELDKSFIRDLSSIIIRSTEAFEKYEFSIALQETEKFFWNAFTDNYIELVKNRCRVGTDEEIASAISTLQTSLNVLLRLFAPFIPTITEEIWSWSFAKETGVESIHQSKWPTIDELSNISNPTHNESFQIACETMSSIRKSKSELGLGNSREISGIDFYCQDKVWTKLSLVLKDVLLASNSNTYQIHNEGYYDADLVKTTIIPMEDGAKELS